MTRIAFQGVLSRRRLGALLLVGLLSAFAAVYAKYADLLVLTEARDYLRHGGWVTDLPGQLRAMLVPSGTNTRPASMLSFAILERACGYDHVCVNVAGLALLALCGVLVFTHVLQVTKDAVLAALACMLWLFSVGTLDAAVWQAVMHDKLALAFSLIALTVSWAFLGRRSVVALLVSNVAVTCAVALAFNSKESAFFLLPALLLQVLLFTGEKTPRGYARELSTIAAPTAFAAYFIAGYLARLDDSWGSHVLSATTVGEALRNAAAHASHLFGVTRESWQTWWAPAIVLGVLTAVLLRDGRTRGSAPLRDPDSLPLLYFGGLFLLALAPVALAKYHPPYYLLIPSVGFYASIVTLAARARRAGVLVLACAPFLFAFHFANHGRYQDLLTASRSFETTLETLRRVVPDPRNRPFHFVLEDDMDHEFYLLRGPNGLDPSILNFTYRTDGEHALDRAEAGSGAARNPDDWYVLIGADYRAEAIFLGTRRLYPRGCDHPEVTK